MFSCVRARVFMFPCVCNRLGKKPVNQRRHDTNQKDPAWTEIVWVDMVGTHSVISEGIGIAHVVFSRVCARWWLSRSPVLGEMVKTRRADDVSHQP